MTEQRIFRADEIHKPQPPEPCIGGCGLEGVPVIAHPAAAGYFCPDCRARWKQEVEQAKRRAQCPPFVVVVGEG